jgi:hypothetical protein
MSYRLPATASLESLIRYASGVNAGLLAMDALKPLADPWSGWRQSLRQARDLRDDELFALDTARARLRVLDSEWDRLVVLISGEAYLLSGKKADAEPYRSLFGAVTAQEATRLGAAKATAFGDRLVLHLAQAGHARLAELAQEFQPVNVRLKAAEAEVTAAEDKASLQGSQRRKLVREVEAQIGVSEVGILQLFPGRRDLVRAVLAPPRPERREREAPEPEDLSSEGQAAPGP